MIYLRHGRFPPLPDRRQQPDVPRVPRAAADDQRLRAGHPRGLRLRHDADEAHRRPQAGVHRRVVRPRRSDLPPRPRRRLQGDAQPDADRPDRSGAARAPGLPRARGADPDDGSLRSRRRHGHARPPGRGARLRGRARHRRQGLLPAGGRPDQGLQPARPWHVVRRRGREAEVRRAARAGDRRAGADGRHVRQRQGRARHRREGRARSDHGVRIARGAARAGRRGPAEALSRSAARPRRGCASEPGAGHDPHRLPGDVRSRRLPLHRRDPRRRVQAVHRSGVPLARPAVRADGGSGRARLRGRRARRHRRARRRVPRRRAVRAPRRHRRRLADARHAGRPQPLDEGLPGALRAARAHARHRRCRAAAGGARRPLR